eukprot:15281638-Alexandrium_andersonii.AAC.1
MEAPPKVRARRARRAEPPGAPPERHRSAVAPLCLMVRQELGAVRRRRAPDLSCQPQASSVRFLRVG